MVTVVAPYIYSTHDVEVHGVVDDDMGLDYYKYNGNVRDVDHKGLVLPTSRFVSTPWIRVDRHT